MGAKASQITSLTIVCSTISSRRRSKKTSKLRVTGLCAGNSPVTTEFPAQSASNAENVSIDDVIMKHQQHKMKREAWLDSWDEPYFNGLMQDCSISSTLAMEMLQSCTKTSICHSNLDGCIFSGLLDNTRSVIPYHFSMFCRARCRWLRQGCSIASELAMGILQSFTKPSIWLGEGLYITYGLSELCCRYVW